jgi:sulfate adenylyltransferase
VTVLRLDSRRTADVELLANGGYRPLEGFLGRADWEAVIETMRLADGRPWPIPVTLGTDRGRVGQTLTLVGHEGTVLALSLAQGDVVRARGDGHDRAPHAAARDPRA